ncbi:MAG: hypothetical protein R2849_00200 [Thermomicrobiales bacterium]
MFIAYPPLEASQWFYLAYVLFAVGALFAAVILSWSTVGARLPRRSPDAAAVHLRDVAAAIIALFSIISGAIAIVPLCSTIGAIDYVDPGIYRLPLPSGHGAQQINLAAMVGIWHKRWQQSLLSEADQRGAQPLCLRALHLFHPDGCDTPYSGRPRPSAPGCGRSIPATSSMPPCSAA